LIWLHFAVTTFVAVIVDHCPSTDEPDGIRVLIEARAVYSPRSKTAVKSIRFTLDSI
jgi:hypothetical protein